MYLVLKGVHNFRALQIKFSNEFLGLPQLARKTNAPSEERAVFAKTGCMLPTCTNLKDLGLLLGLSQFNRLCL